MSQKLMLDDSPVSNGKWSSELTQLEEASRLPKTAAHY